MICAVIGALMQSAWGMEMVVSRTYINEPVDGAFDESVDVDLDEDETTIVAPLHKKDIDDQWNPPNDGDDNISIIAKTMLKLYRNQEALAGNQGELLATQRGLLATQKRLVETQENLVATQEALIASQKALVATQQRLVETQEKLVACTIL